jgi:hypothetical protein
MCSDSNLGMEWTTKTRHHNPTKDPQPSCRLSGILAILGSCLRNLQRVNKYPSQSRTFSFQHCSKWITPISPGYKTTLAIHRTRRPTTLGTRTCQSRYLVLEKLLCFVEYVWAWCFYVVKRSGDEIEGIEWRERWTRRLIECKCLLTIACSTYCWRPLLPMRSCTRIQFEVRIKSQRKRSKRIIAHQHGPEQP